MYRPDLRDAMIEGYTEALDSCKTIVEQTLDVFLKTAKTIDEEITINGLFIQSKNKWRSYNA